jgi:hypothetical protein
MQRPNLPHLVLPSAPPAKLPSPSARPPAPAAPGVAAVPQAPVLAPTTECPPNTTLSNRNNIHKDNNNLLRKLASSHYQSYTTALTVTIAVGCFLLLLNILIFAGIYHQRDRNNGKSWRRQEVVVRRPVAKITMRKRSISKLKAVASKAIRVVLVTIQHIK